jgi:hypothetical protein
MIRKIFVAAAFAACFLPTLFAWNETGHRLIAAIAYDNLTPQARGRVDALLRQHPDYSGILTKNAPADAAGKARAAFLVASYWPDTIRDDARFYDESRAGAQPTPQLPGFPNMGRHTMWHYVDFNFSEDGTAIPPIETPNALGELGRLMETVAGTNEMLAAYSLPWLVHLAGDVHNPLHTVSRYSKALPKGDRGGNDAWVRPSQQGSAALNLHAYWDNLGGSDSSSAYVDRFAAEVTKDYRAKYANTVPETHPETWVVEGFYNARSTAYKFGLDNGTRENPITLTKQYEDSAQAVSRERLAAAGLRLAAVLNARLR